MLAIGEYHILKIDRDTEPGLFLKDDDGNEVLLPNKYKPETFEIEDSLEVFVYLDHEERPVATTLKPFVKLDEFGFLKCVEVSEIGAFMDWGLEKHLFVPFKEQAVKMREGERYLIFCYLDELTDRLVGSSKVDAFLDNSELTVTAFEEVDLIVANPTELGWNVIVNEIHKGLLYKDEVFQKLHVGDRLKGFVKKTRPDGKIDISLQRPGYRSIEPNAQELLNLLEIKGGFLALTDKSSPKEIEKEVQMSKKSFKRALGNLYKQRKVEIKDNGIYLKKGE
ncbi:GntR family transcriptional regulator [Salinimicrobium tongyeongense]|uniref:GntR family transcriptional regulator n=1 Tax=Salinimicrobium tongyeongense TaxID=2809707 RepID=A0ABY6NSD2_9FLAO|nr:S1-like domain-containing RNA-binding protein [Salinimicrobium tongyeongense]UZH55571.1 GntR family transcriptional regulator [Salinimicrobium tongyeongense]